MFRNDTFVDVLRSWAERRPDRTALTFLEDGEVPTALTYEALDRRARAIATGIRKTVQVGDRALLLHPPGLEFVTAFFGCLYAGVVPVPAYPPRNPRHFPRIEAILADAEARCVLTQTDFQERLAAWLGQRDGTLPVICTDRLLDEEARRWEPDSDSTPDTLAFLQYTSGSTGDPKGVMVTHGNLVSNQRMIQHACGHSEGLVGVSWLPIYHDMGLIGTLMQPLFLGGHYVFMSPAAFLQKPRRWLAAISNFRAHLTGGPNFAFRMCTKTVRGDQKAGLDLSALEVLFSGSEPISATDLEEFAEAFRETGLRREALYCCYGMAETTLMATGSAPGAGPVFEIVDAGALAMNVASPPGADANSRRVVVGCGKSVEGQEMVIVDPDGANHRVLEDGRVGEIWVRGPNVARGYWRKPQLTRETFEARLTDARSNDDRPFLRTGDLGFLRDGELFVTGRIKDLIIIRGRNHYPHDLELTAQSSHPALRADGGAAFSVEIDGEERLVVVQEIDRHQHREAQEAGALIRARIAEDHEVTPYAVVLLGQNGVPKTSSGKIQRSACARAFLAGSLPVVYAWTDAPGAVADVEDVPLARTREDVLAALPAKGVTILEDRLRYHVASVLRLAVSEIPLDQPLVTMGIDSLMAVDLKNRVEMETGVPLPLLQLINGASLSELARSLVGSITGDTVAVPDRGPTQVTSDEETGQSLLVSILSLKKQGP